MRDLALRAKISTSRLRRSPAALKIITLNDLLHEQLKLLEAPCTRKKPQNTCFYPKNMPPSSGTTCGELHFWAQNRRLRPQNRSFWVRNRNFWGLHRPEKGLKHAVFTLKTCPSHWRSFLEKVILDSKSTIFDHSGPSLNRRYIDWGRNIAINHDKWQEMTLN